MKRGWNISNENFKEIFEFIDNFKPRNDIEKRTKKRYKVYGVIPEEFIR